MTNLWIRKLMIALLLVCFVGSSSDARVLASQLSDPSKTISIPPGSEGVQPKLPAGFHFVASTPASLVLNIRAPVYRMEAASSGNQPCQILKADDYFQAFPPGSPGLLSAGVMFGVPLEGTPAFTIQSIDTINLPGKYHLCPAATLAIQRDQSGQVINKGESLTVNHLSYSQNAFIPAQPLELVVSGMIRSQRVAQLRFTPFQYNPATDEIKIVSNVNVEIQLGNSSSPADPVNVVDEGSFETILQKTLINYDQAKPWRVSHSQTPSATTRLTPSVLQDQSQYKILVDQDGIYQVTYAALQSAGVPVDNLDPRTFRLLNQSVEVPIYVFGEQDGVFNPNDYFLFYAQKITTKFTNTNVYWLSWGNGNGLRMSTQDGSVNGAQTPPSFKTTLHLEENTVYVNDSPSGIANDHWYWYFLNAYNGPASQDFTFSLHNLDGNSSTARISGLLKGYYADPQHHTLIYINGHLIDDHYWTIYGDYAFSFDISSSYLVEGTNTITVTCPRDGNILYDYVLINWFEIEYDHTFTAENDSLAFSQPDQWQFQVGGFITNTINVFDISNPMAPIRILGGKINPLASLYQIDFEQNFNGPHRYLVLTPSQWLIPKSITLDQPSNLHDTANQADYIIISHADFLNAIQPLAAYRARHGFQVKVVDVQDIYDEFNGGVFDPQAIQSFLSYAYAHWSAPAPAFVLLVGDGNYDFKNYYGNSGPNYIPPFLGEFDPWIGETASDNHFVTISGNDNLPDMYIGRLPANTAADTTSMVNKIISYEQNPVPGDWTNRLTFIADNADSGGDFPAHSNLIADHYLPVGFSAEKIYYGIPPYSDAPSAQAAIINSINQGRLIIHYTGHASGSFWADNVLFGVDSIASLTNTGMYPLFLPMTCQEGYFISPLFTSLAESLVRAPDKGAIASFSPSGFGLVNGHDLLAQGVYQALFYNGTTQFGAATTFAKYYLSINGPGFSDLIDTYNLFGDPASRLNISPTPVLLSFTGTAKSGTIQLDWETVNESWLVGFNLYRSATPDGILQKLNSDMIGAQYPGQTHGALYEYFDRVSPGKNYFYWIELIQGYGRDLIGPIAVNLPYWLTLPTIVR